jgi:4-diphosphocytidyl-2-C-methyl-D-erythritol kinase
MLRERRDAAVVVRAPAKVNLFLEVLGKRPDGYHEIATLLVAVSLYDTLEFKEDVSGAFQLQCNVPELSTGPDNLVCKAAALLQRRAGRLCGARVSLTKRIPMAAGLAGGSTDAAAALAGLNRLWRLGLGNEDLAGLAAELGSDVPFFLGGPAAWCTGRGEVVTPLKLARPLDLVLACPPFGLSTAEVYRNVTVPARPEGGDELRRAVERGDVGEIGRRLHNRLQEAAGRLRPELGEVLRRLEALGPAGQMMSGSGSCLFAVCRDGGEAQHIARALGRQDATGASGTGAGDRLRVFVVRSCS